MLEFGNCVFMPKWEAPNMKWFAELGEVDPDGAINSMNAEHRTGAENVVDFGERRVVKMGKRGMSHSPWWLFPKQGARALLILRAIMLLEGKHTDRRKAKGSIHMQLKKRSAFDDEAEKEVEEARKKKRWWLTR
ncbi:hypothetical protein GYMLUDRAFT_997208 [Collybiopsis luxurians FD-317 M1]|uniref:Uncharacterized protein n=1 Tax=Collybiopsis luxurians FD-317 M1 TaxID=944289 RepID=A0A0D0BZP0_9AGAR|nr:hypothetical protein GYMLUDRAFT_997208 [Collybiopsis luxurians FD-317 M1]